MAILRELKEKIEREIIDVDDYKDETCTMKTKHYKLLKTSSKLANESEQILEEKEQIILHKNLVIRQYQQQKEKDDKEIILHRIRLTKCLEKK